MGTPGAVAAGVTALSLLITPFLMQASNKWLLLADPEAGTLVGFVSCCLCFKFGDA